MQKTAGNVFFLFRAHSEKRSIGQLISRLDSFCFFFGDEPQKEFSQGWTQGRLASAAQFFWRVAG